MIDVVNANSTDGPAIGGILSNWIDESLWMPRIHTTAQDIKHGSWLVEVCQVVVVRNNDEVLGFLAQQGADIQALYVANSMRGHGIGTALLEHAKGAENRLELWTFQANTAAQRFYDRHGFTEDRRGDGAENDEKLPDIHMVWQRGE